MTIQEFLAAQGLSPEEIAAVVGNEKQSKAMSAALSKYDEGSSALAKAQAEKDETANFWEQKTQELQGSVTRLTAAEKKAAEADAERARYAAYLKSLKDQGYDVPDSLVTAPTKNTPVEPQYMTREEALKMARGTAPDLISLTKVSNEFRHLYGREYLDIDTDFAEAQKQGKPLTEYARTKYGFEAKRQEMQKAEEQKRIDAIVAEQMKTKEAELVAKYGSNPETRSPLPSKFDRLSKSNNFKSDSWKSQEGREANRADRLKRFENISIN